MKNISGSGIGITGVITIVFITLKCFNVIDWPWWNFNPFSGSVLIAYVFIFWILFFIALIFIAYKIASIFGIKK